VKDITSIVFIFAFLQGSRCQKLRLYTFAREFLHNYS